MSCSVLLRALVINFWEDVVYFKFELGCACSLRQKQTPEPNQILQHITLRTELHYTAAHYTLHTPLQSYTTHPRDPHSAGFGWSLVTFGPFVNIFFGARVFSFGLVDITWGAAMAAFAVLRGRPVPTDDGMTEIGEYRRAGNRLVRVKGPKKTHVC